MRSHASSDGRSQERQPVRRPNDGDGHLFMATLRYPLFLLFHPRRVQSRGKPIDTGMTSLTSTVKRKIRLATFILLALKNDNSTS